MKRIAMVILAVFFTCGWLSAQGFTFNGSFISGLQLDIQDDGDPVLSAYNQATDKRLYRFRFGGIYAHNENVGFNFGIQSDQQKNVDVYSAFGYANFFNKALLVNLGLVNNSTFNSLGNLNNDVGEGVGVQLQFKPPVELLEPLNLGVGYYIPGSSTSSSRAAEDSASLWDAKAVFSIAYNDRKAVRLGASFSLGDGGKPDTFLGGVSLLAIPNLTFIVEGNGVSLAADDPMGIIDELIEYKIGDLGIRLKSFQFINHGNMTLKSGVLGMVVSNEIQAQRDTVNNKANINWTLEPTVSYTINSFIPRISLVAGSFGYKNDTTNTEYSEYILGARPAVILNLARNTLIDFGYLVHNTWTQMDINGDVAKKDFITHKVFVDIQWTY
jgi:hypothetical protein